MWRKRVAWLLLVVGLWTMGPPAGSAQEWARKMFQTLEHDFGVVVRGAKAEFAFVLTNPYVEDVHIVSVRSSCACTTARITKQWLKTHEQSAIVATYNTHLFVGAKGATLTVVFDKPFYAEVQLQVRGYIRSDVVFSPPSVDLGEVKSGVPVERKVDIHYVGRNDWQILQVRSPHSALKTELVETGRAAGQVWYQLTVRSEGQLPAGYYQDYLILVTNDRIYSELPLLVEGRIRSGITVSPASLFLGVVAPGQKVTKKVVVRASTPFRILSISADADCFQFSVPPDDAPKTIHVIPITFIAGKESGKLMFTIRIKTDLDSQMDPSLVAYAVVGGVR
ncbi:MAG: DUF1573 domain-containing protein [Thermoguttaceae bacterium]|nr:DUF1573 domain-containing protein [Thermoguttaceae bacterium]MDW8036638.1 DUF1573 domain-containing protein [Thermoguttaceae bacterium]